MRILTWNLWHGLNPYQRVWMSLLESPMARRRRHRRQQEILADWCRYPDDLLCLQELNPLGRRLEKLRSSLALFGEGCVVNAGLKLGRMGLPPFLEEGLGTFAAEAYKDPRWEEMLLSGRATEFRGPLGLHMVFQFEERRKALVFQAKRDGKRIALVNLHLHAGPESSEAHRKRRQAEVELLLQWLKPRLDQWDVLLVAGDFNCDPDSPTLQPLQELGLVNLMKLSPSAILPSWDPASNALTRLSPRAARDAETREWDSTHHFFDQIFYKGPKPEKVSLTLLREPELSDHYGVAAEII